MRISRDRYARLYGPTAATSFRLADTDLVCEVERDLRCPARRRSSAAARRSATAWPRASAPTPRGALDLVITNVVVMDPMLGHRQGAISASRRGGSSGSARPATRTSRTASTPKLVIGPGTEVIAGEHLIATPGGIDSHIHMICPQQVYEALSNGITTIIGGGTGPADGTNATTCTPGPVEHRPDAPGGGQAAGERRACSARGTPAARRR